VFVSTIYSACIIRRILLDFTVPTTLGELHKVPRYVNLDFTVPTTLGELHKVPRYVNLKNLPFNPLQVKYFPELFVFKHLKGK
jgi:hypothetical protein